MPKYVIEAPMRGRTASYCERRRPRNCRSGSSFDRSIAKRRVFPDVVAVDGPVANHRFEFMNEVERFAFRTRTTTEDVWALVAFQGREEFRSDVPE